MEAYMKKNSIPNDISPCCELCEYAAKMEVTGDLLCKYKNSLKKKQTDDCCRYFSFNIFAYKPSTSIKAKVFDFTKI